MGGDALTFAKHLQCARREADFELVFGEAGGNAVVFTPLDARLTLFLFANTRVALLT